LVTSRGERPDSRVIVDRPHAVDERRRADLPGRIQQILLVGINYRPELTGIGPYTAGLAEHLASRGRRVTVITGLPHYPDWRIRKGTPRRLTGQESMFGVAIVRAAHYVPKQQTAIRRALYEGSFGLTSLIAGLRIEKTDAVLGIVPSLSGGIVARALARRHQVPYGLLFQDVMAPAARQSGLAGGGAVAGATEYAERWSVAQAKVVGVVTTAFIPYLNSLGVSSERIRHVPNWTRTTAPVMSVEKTRERFGWSKGIQIALHAGNMGMKQNLEQVVRAAHVAAERRDPVQFVFAGGGNRAADVRDAAGDLPNVSFLGVQPDGIHASLLAAADVLLLSESPAQLDMSLPSKLTSYFSAGRPILAAVPEGGSSATELDGSRAGIQVPVNDPEALVSALERLRKDDSLVDRLSTAGPAYASLHTHPSNCLARGEALVDEIAGGPTPADLPDPPNE
jgi:colanic acid biosynthesis glycosyl transferase WcaI